SSSLQSRLMNNDWNRLSNVRARLTVRGGEPKRSGARIVTRYPPRPSRSDFATALVIPQSKAAAFREVIHRNVQSKRVSSCWVIEMSSVVCKKLLLKFSVATERM